MTTLVTGFISLYDYTETEPEKTFELYFQRGIELLKNPINKIFFVESKYLEKFKSYKNSNTIIIPFEKTDMFLWPRREKILNCELPSNRNDKKDTHDYMIVMSQKNHWMKIASEINPYHTQNFVWIDFGISYIFKNDLVLFHLALENLNNKVYNKIRIAGCWLPSNVPDYHSNVLWYFCGGTFGGDKESILKFYNLLNETIDDFISRNKWSWEVNLWFDIYKKSPELFSWYYCPTHDSSMLLYY